MSWLFPAGAAASVAIVAIVLLHMRHRLPEVIPFPLLAFWPRVPSETRESPRWRRPPLTLLFLLQLFIALLLVLAFMRPAIPGLDAFGGQRTGAIHHLIVLDASTSMDAGIAGTGTRWEAALREADALADDWQEGDGLTVVLAASDPVVRSAADSRQVGELRDWLRGLVLPGGTPDGTEIARLVDASELPGLDRRLTVITDGGLDLAGGGSVVRVADGDAGNVAIVSTTTAPLDGGGMLIEADVLHDRTGTETIPWVARAGGQDIASGTVTLAQGATGRVEVRVPSGYERVTLELVAGDALPADDRAVVMTGGSGLTGLSIVLVSDVPGPLQRALEVLPGATVEVYPSSTPGLSAIATNVDLVVYDASVPAPTDVPDAPMLFVQPPGVDSAWQIAGVSPNPALAEIASDDPVLRDITLDGVRYGETPIYILPENARVLAGGVEGETTVPLIWRGTFSEHPYVAWAFDPGSSNIVDRVVFPILVGQTVYELAGASGESALSPGELVTLPLPAGAVAVQVEDPAGRGQRLEPYLDADGRSVASFRVSAVTGAWTVIVEDQGGEALDRGTLAVNAGDASESRLSQPGEVEIALGDGVVTGDADGGAREVLTDVWPLLVGAAAGVLIAEWWIWLGRSLPSRRTASEVTP